MLTKEKEILRSHKGLNKQLISQLNESITIKFCVVAGYQKRTWCLNITVQYVIWTVNEFVQVGLKRADPFDFSHFSNVWNNLYHFY